MELQNLLLKSKQQLSTPLIISRTKLLIFLNSSFITLLPIFLISEKLSSGQFVPVKGLWYVYIPVAITNSISLFYNIWLLKKKSKSKFFDNIISWASVLSVMAMSIFNMVGYGNPSNDSIITDFALAHTLIMMSAIILGQRPAIIWTCIIFGILVFLANKNGWEYEFNYQTPQELKVYNNALKGNERWAVERKAELIRLGIKPPKLSRYFNVWGIFTIVSIISALIISGITQKLNRIIPDVVNNLENAIQESANERIFILEKENKLLLEKAILEEQNLLAKQEALEYKMMSFNYQFNSHFLYNTLNTIYNLSLEERITDFGEAILMLSEILRYSLNDNQQNNIIIDDEIKHLTNFINIHRLRYDNDFYIEFETTGETEGIYILPMILISLIENSFKHGVVNNPLYPVIVNLDTTNDSLFFYVKNKKKDYKNRKIISTGIGIDNMKKRLDLFYNDSYKLTFLNEEEFYTCSLRINLKL